MVPNPLEFRAVTRPRYAIQTIPVEGYAALGVLDELAQLVELMFTDPLGRPPLGLFELEEHRQQRGTPRTGQLGPDDAAGTIHWGRDRHRKHVPGTTGAWHRAKEVHTLPSVVERPRRCQPSVTVRPFSQTFDPFPLGVQQVLRQSARLSAWRIRKPLLNFPDRHLPFVRPCRP